MRSIRSQLLTMMIGGTLFITILVSLYVSIGVIQQSVKQNSEFMALNAIERSVQMFLVSTIKYQEQFEAAPTSEEKEAIRQRWTETIIAVDNAVIHDFGEDAIRVRLIGDASIFDSPPLGGSQTEIEIPFEREAANAFASGRTEPLWAEDNDVLRVSVPLPANAHDGCATCHSLEPGDPTILGTLNAYVPQRAMLNEAFWDTVTTVVVLMGILALCFAALFVIISGRIVKPLHGMSEVLKRLATGDLNVEAPKADQSREVSDLAASITVFRDNMKEADRLSMEAKEAAEKQAARAQNIDKLTKSFQNDVGTVVARVTNASGSMDKVAHDLIEMSDESSQQATSIAGAAAQASVNVSSVAHAATELSSSIQSIAEQVARSADISARAVDEARKSSNIMQGLNDASQKIGEVVRLITSIADQTNLLALNATIEAARAGNAGKGFAVVAGEVKTLAAQTAKATDEIGSQ